MILGGSKITADGDCRHEIKRCLLLGRKAITNLDNVFKSRDITLPTKVHLVKAMVFPVVMLWRWEPDHKESWALKNWSFWTVVLEIKPVNPKRKQSWIFFGRTDVEAEAPILWPPDAKNWLIGKDPDAGKDWMWEEKRMTEDETAGWHHLLIGHELEPAPGVGDGQGIPTCCRPWGHKESDTTERLSWILQHLEILPSKPQ